MTTLATVDGLTVRFKRRRRLTELRPEPFTAVDGISFELKSGAITAIVGESGSGKTTVARALLRLVPFEGAVTVDDVAVHELPRYPGIDYRRRIQAVFQDPLQALNPRHSAEQLIGEPLRVHGHRDAADHSARIDELLEQVGLDAELRPRTTRELSGGQRQRVAIARALASEPRVLVLDEALSALDVTTGNRVAGLLRALVDADNSMLFIAHDLALVRQLCDEVLVMHHGRIVERGSPDDVCDRPQDPYTQRLIAAIPDPAAALGR